MLGNRINISVPLLASLAAIAIAGLIVMVYLFDVATAVLGPGTGDIEPDARLAQFVADHEKEMEEYAGRFDGRSVFYIPPVRQPPRTVVDRTPEPDRDPEPYVAPPPKEPEDIKYTGPSPVFAVGSQIWFQKPSQNEPMMRLRVGEEAHNVKLVSVSLPSYITVEFRGKEFQLDLLGENFPKSWSLEETGAEDFIKEAPGREQPTPGITVVTGKDDASAVDDQPTLSASDLETQTESDNASSMARPEPMSSDVTFDLRQPGGGFEDDDNEDDDDESTEAAAPVTMPSVEQPLSQWHGPPIPEHLLARHTNATMRDEPVNDDATDVVELAPATGEQLQPPRDFEAEDEQTQAGDPEADAEADASSGDDNDDDEDDENESGRLIPPTPVDPVVPPE